MDYIIQPFASANLEELALLASGLNARRETASTFCCAKAEDIQRDFEKNVEYGWVCWADGRPAGLLNCFPDKEKNNADCSLLLDLHGDAYEEAAAALVLAAKKKLGQEMECTFFFPKENEDCGRFLTQYGACRQENEYILLLRQEDWRKPGTLAARPRPVTDAQRDAFATLHDAIFPGVYCSGKDILNDLGKTRFVFVIPDEGGVAAYGVLKTHGGRQATVEIVGVREDARRRGYGRAMLNYLAEQAFTQFGAKSLELVVDADNTNALALYLDTGFFVRQENNCYILR